MIVRTRSLNQAGSLKDMTVTISLILSKETEFFNEKVKNHVYREVQATADLINATGGSLEKKAYQSLLSRYSKDSTGEIISGGRHTPFLYYFPVSALTAFIIKPYHLNLHDIANHYVTVEEVNAIYRNYRFKFRKEEIKIIFSDVFGFGTFTVDQKVLPFIIQRYSPGIKLTEINTKESRQLIGFLPQVVRHLAKEGVIVDPYNRNWFLHGFSNDHRCLDCELLEYIDLGYMHSLDTNHRVKAALNSLKSLPYQELP
jgi:hypothetical protein